MSIHVEVIEFTRFAYGGEVWTFRQVSDWFNGLSKEEQSELGELLSGGQFAAAHDWVAAHGGNRAWAAQIAWSR